MFTKLEKLTAGGILFLLPFLCNPFGGEMYLQFEAPKLFGAFILGNFCFSVILWRALHPAFGVAHFCFAISVLLTGFGGSQLYPFCYWIAGLGLGLYACHYKNPIRPDAHLWIWKVIVVSALLSGLQAYGQMMGFHWPIQYAEGIEQTRPIAFLGQQTKLGAYLAPCAAASLALGWFPAFAFLSLIVLATKSSFSVFALTIGAMTVAVGNNWIRRRWLVLATISGILLTVIGPRYGYKIPALYDHGRQIVYADIWKAIQERPILGHGPGSFQAKFHTKHQSQLAREMGGGDFLQAHNDYLQVPYEGGIPGWIGMLFMLGSILWAYHSLFSRQRIWLNFQPLTKTVLCAQGSLAALLVNAIGNFPWTLSPHYLIGIMSAAILLRAARN